MRDENDNETLGTWAERGLNLPADRADVAEILGEAQADKPVALGVLADLRTAKAAFDDQRSTMDDSQWQSDEVWRDVSGINRDALVAGGFIGEIPDLVEPEEGDLV